MTSKDINLYVSTNPTTTETPIKNVTLPREDKPEALANIDMGALLYEPLHLQSVERVAGKKYMGKVKHFGMVRVLDIELWNEDIELIEKTLHITVGERYEFAEPLELYAKKYIGTMFKNILRIENLTFSESVATSLPDPEKTEAELRSLYKFHGETMTCEVVIEKGRGIYKVWQIAMRAIDGTLLRIDAWAEHRRMLQEAGYDVLPERGSGPVNLNAEVVIKYLPNKGYRITHVYPKAKDEPTGATPQTKPELSIASENSKTPVRADFELQQYQAGEWSKIDESSHERALSMLVLVARNPRMVITKYGLIWRIVRTKDNRVLACSKQQPDPIDETPVTREPEKPSASESGKVVEPPKDEPAPAKSPFQTRFGLHVELLKWTVQDEWVLVRHEDGEEKEVALGDLRAPDGLKQITEYLNALTPAEPVTPETLNEIKQRLDHIKEHGLFDEDETETVEPAIKDVVETPVIEEKLVISNGTAKADEPNKPAKVVDAYEHFIERLNEIGLIRAKALRDILIDWIEEQEAIAGAIKA